MIQPKKSRELALEEAGKAKKNSTRVLKKSMVEKSDVRGVAFPLLVGWLRVCQDAQDVPPLTAPLAPLQSPHIMDEWQNALLLVILYMIQGVPLGLSMGSM